MPMIAIMTTMAIAPSFATASGKNGLPAAFWMAYPRRYCSFSRWFTRSDLLAAQLVALLRLQPGRGGRAELRDEVEVGADQRDERARDQEHVDRVEARER